MGVKIMIRRKFRDEVKAEDLEAIDDLRIKALRQPGYIGGETVVNRDDPTEVMVVSAWTGREQWEGWLEQPERKALEDKLASRLVEPPRISAFMPAADYAIGLEPGERE